MHSQWPWSLGQQLHRGIQWVSVPEFFGNTWEERNIFGLFSVSEENVTLMVLVEATHMERDSLVAQMVKSLPAMQETWVWSPGQEDPLEKGMASH